MLLKDTVVGTTVVGKIKALWETDVRGTTVAYNTHHSEINF